MKMNRHTYDHDASGLPGFQGAEVHYIPLNRLKYPYQSDEATNESKVMENVRRMKAAESLAPVVVGPDHDVLDGHHKIEAAERMGYTHAPCVVGCDDDFTRAAANARYRGMWNGMDKSMDLYHGTSTKAAHGIQKTGFRAGGGPDDLGVAVYFKSPDLDKHEASDATSTQNVLGQYENGAVIKAGLKPGAKVLDLSDPKNTEKKEMLDALMSVWAGKTSPYELYAKHHGYDAIIGELPDKVNEGWMIGVYNPSKIKVGETMGPFPEELTKSIGATKKLYKDLPEGGVWRTIRGNHVYIVNGRIAAGGIPGVLTNGDKIVKKMTKKDIAEHQKYYDAKQGGKANAAQSAKATGKKNAVSGGTASAEPQGASKYHMFVSGQGYKPVKGKKVDVGHHTVHAFVHKAGSNHYVNEARSGLVISHGTTEAKAVASAKQRVALHGAKAVNARADKHIAENGQSPTDLDAMKQMVDNGSKPKTKGGTTNGAKSKSAKSTGQSNGGKSGKGGAAAKGGTGKGGQKPTGDRPANKGLPVAKSKIVKDYPEHGIAEISDHKAFHKAIMAAKNGNDHGAFVHAYEPDEYKEKKLFLSHDGKAGVAVTKDGDIVSVFKHPDSTQKGVSGHLLQVALKNGGKKLDCFDGFLPKLYSKYGFQPVAKLPFNKEYAPDGWNYDRDGTPDVVFMKHNGDSVDKVNATDYPTPDMSKVPEVKDYDEGAALQEGKQPEPAPASAEPIKAQPAPVPAEKDTRITGRHKEAMRIPPGTLPDAAKQQIAEQAKKLANTPYLASHTPDQMKKLDKNTRGALDTALKAARANPDDFKAFNKALSPDVQRAMAKAGIDDAKFHSANGTAESTQNLHQRRLERDYKPEIDTKAAEKLPNAAKEQLKSTHGGTDEEYHLYHGTSMPRVSHILSNGFGMNGDYSDFGNAAYFKMPALDKYDMGKVSEGTTSNVVNNFATGENSAVLKVKVTGGNILDCHKNGRPPELDNLIKGWRARPQSKEDEQKIGRDKRRALLHYEGKADVSKTKDMSDEDLDNAIKQHYGAENPAEIGKLLSNTSPYELYAKKHGYDMVIDKLPSFQEEGWQVGVYNPNILKVVDVGKKLSGGSNQLKLVKSLNAGSQPQNGKTPPYTLLHFGYENGQLHLYVGAQDDRGKGKSNDLVKSVRVGLVVNLVKGPGVDTPHEEELWEKSKQIVTRQYGKSEADGDDYWRLVNGVYQHAKGKRGNKKKR